MCTEMGAWRKQGQIEPDKLQGLWEAVVSKHSGSPRLWRSYLLCVFLPFVGGCRVMLLLVSG